MTALCPSMIGGLLALLSSVVAASTVYLVLVSVSGLAVVIVCFQQFGPSDRLRTKPIIVYPNNGDIYDSKTKTWSLNPTGFRTGLRPSGTAMDRRGSPTHWRMLPNDSRRYPEP